MTDSSILQGVAAQLRKDALRNRGGQPTFRIVLGWKFGMSIGPVPLPSREVVEAVKGSIAQRMGESGFARASYEEIAGAMAAADVAHVADNRCIFSASLHPRGRSSSEEDWKRLGEMIAAVGAPPESLCTPFETTNPSDVHYWIWEPDPTN